MPRAARARVVVALLALGAGAGVGACGGHGSAGNAAAAPDAMPVSLHPPDAISTPITAANDPRRRKAYRIALEHGRALARKQDWPASVAELSRAVELAPDDARALSELGFVAYKAGDLALGEKATSRSIERATDPKVKGASLYNLGRIQEERGDKPAAVASYRASLLERKSHIVEKRLATLDRGAAEEAARDVLSVHALAGPFASPEKWCAQLAKKRAPGAPAKVIACDAKSTRIADGKGDAVIEHVAAPWRAVRLVAVTTRDDGGARETDYALAVQTDAGWFFEPAFAHLFNMEGEGDSNGNCQRVDEWLAIDTFELEDAVPGGGPEVVLRWKLAGDDAHLCGEKEAAFEVEGMLVAGVGKSGRPSATAVVPLARAAGDGDLDGDEPPDAGGRPVGDAGAPSASGGTTRSALKWRFDGGDLVLEGATPSIDATLAPFVGRHPLKFP